MVQDFQNFLRSLGMGAASAAVPQPQVPAPAPMPAPAPAAPPPLPPSAVQVQPPPPQPGMDTSPQAILAALAAMQQPQAPPPAPVAQMGSQAAPVARAMTPAEFAMMSNLRQEEPSAPPEREEGEKEPPGTGNKGGTWVTVAWNYQGTQYYLLMPEWYARNLPEGATTVGDPIVDEPDRVRIAEQAGEQGQQGQTFTGLLSQAPPEIQGVFGVDIAAPPGVKPPPIETADAGVLETTQAAVNDRGETGAEVRARLAQGAASGLLRNTADLPGQAGRMTEEGTLVPPLTPGELEKTDPAKAALLRSQYIDFVPVDKMVVQDQDGILHVVDAAETAPEGTEIITYGGATPPPVKNPSVMDDQKIFGVIPVGESPVGTAIETAIEGPIAMAGPALGVIEEVGQRIPQAGVSTVINRTEDIPFLGEIVEQVLQGSPATAVLADIPVVGGYTQYGYPAFVNWMTENPEEADRVRREGYTSPETGETFTGERAVWERFQADRNIVQRTADSILTDLTNLVPSLGAPVRSVGGRILQGADEAGPILGRARRGVGETLNVVADVADIPEEALGAVATGVGGVVRGIGRQLERAPIFQPSDETIARNAQEEVETQLTDVTSQPNRAMLPEPEGGQHVFASGNRAERGEDDLYTLYDADGEVVMEGASWDAVQLRDRELSTPTVPEEPGVTPESGRGAPEPEGRFVRLPDGTTARIPVQEGPSLAPTAEAQLQRQQAQAPTAPAEELAVDREVTDLGQAPDQGAAPAAEELAVDRPVADLGESPMAIQREETFAQTEIGQRTEAKISKWPAWLRPQTVADRIAGRGRTGPTTSRQVEVARALAPERPDAWDRFVNEVSMIAARFSRRENIRKGNRQWGAVRRSTTNTVEDGFDLKRAHEVMLEANANLGPKGGGIFHKFLAHFGDDAELPRYAWKRWGNTEAPAEGTLRQRGPEGGTHTALDTIEQNGGNYMPGTPLHEAVEVAIYHPDDAIARSALSDIQYRLGVHKKDGTLVETNGNLKIDAKFPTELKETFAGGNVLNAIPKLRREYISLLEESAARANPERLTEADVADLSAITSGEAEYVPGPDLTGMTEAEAAGLPGQEQFEADLARSMEEEAAGLPGQEQFEQDVARTAFEDVATEAANQPQALPYRTGTEAVLETPLGRTVTEAEPIPLGPPGFAARATSAPGQPVGEVPADQWRQSVESIRQWREQTRETQAPLTRGERRRAEREAQKSPVQQRRTLATRTSVMRPDELQSFYVRGRQPSAKQMETLGQEFADGESIIERWDRYVSENLQRQDVSARSVAEAEDQARTQVLNDWAVENLNASQMQRYEAELRKLKKGKKPDDTAWTDAEARIEALERVHERAGRTRFGYRWDTFMSGLREVWLYNALTGPRYIQTQMLGNTVTLILTKHYGVIGDVISPRAVKKAVETAIRKGEAPPSLLREVADGYGLGGQRRLVSGSNAIRDQTGGDIGDAMKASRLPGIGRFTGPLASKTIRDVAAMFDVMPREALWSHIMDTNMLKARQTLRERMLATKPAAMTDEQVGELLDALPQRFSADDVRATFGEFDRTWADRHARDWQEALTKTDKMARDEVKRVFFSGDERNVDRLLRRVFFFHYWMSRATPLYTEAIIRDPVYFYNYLNLLEAMEEDRDLSGSDFVKWFKTPMGYNTLIRPDAFFQAFGSFWEDAGYTPDGENILGRMIRNSPVMVNPVMNMMVNMLGMSGDTFAPDPLGLGKFIQFGQAGIDFANAQLGLGLPPVGNPSDDMLTWARSFITDTLDFLPGVQEIPYSDPMAYKENEVRSIVAQIGLERGLPVDDPLVQAAMVDPSSEMYQEAMKRYSRQDLLDIALRILPVSAVLYPKSQLSQPKERTQAIAAGRGPEGYTPEALALMNERDTIAAATESSRTLQIQEGEYRTLGTPEERGAFKLYNAIRFGSTRETVTIGGRRYSTGDLVAMEDGAREALADQWAEETGNTEAVETVHTLRKEYRDAHPEYAAYSQWQAQLGDYNGGPLQWWQDAVKGNPNAERWYNGLDEADRENEIVLTSTEAYMAYTGEQRAYWEPDPIATRTEVAPTPYNPIGGDGESTSSSDTSSRTTTRGPTKDIITKQIAEYNADMEEYNRLAGEMLGGQQVNVDLINPMARQAVIANLESVGIQKPRMGGYLYDYLQWADTQQGDASIDAYLRYWQEQNPEERDEQAAD